MTISGGRDGGSSRLLWWRRLRTQRPSLVEEMEDPATFSGGGEVIGRICCCSSCQTISISDSEFTPIIVRGEKRVLALLAYKFHTDKLRLTEQLFSSRPQRKFCILLNSSILYIAKHTSQPANFSCTLTHHVTCCDDGKSLVITSLNLKAPRKPFMDRFLE